MPHYLRTLGALALYEGARPERDADPVLANSKSLALLAYVALAPGRRVRRSHLARLLWPDVDATPGRRSLRQALYYLSKRSGAELLRSEEGAVTVVEDALEVDVWAFDRALSEERLADAVELYGGAFLSGFPSRAGREFETWIETQNERIWSGVKAACHELVARAIEADDLDRAVRYGRTYAELNPLDEAARSTLVRALLAKGDRVAAYRQYEAYRTLLAEELGEEPDEALAGRMRELRDEIFAGPGAPGLEASSSAGEDPGGEAGERGVHAGDGDPPGDRRSDRRGAAAGAGAGPLRWALVGAVSAAAVFAAMAVTGWLPDSDRAGPAGWEGADGLLTIRHGAEGDRVSEVTLEDGVASLRGTELPPRVLVSPRRDLLAEDVRTDSGPDVVVRDRSTGEVLARVATRADENAVAWSPDQSRLLVSLGEPLEGEREYRRELVELRLEDGSVRRLAGRRLHTGGSSAVWSPLGDRVAYTGIGDDGRPRLHVADADGSAPRALTPPGAADATPAWSPDGRWIAFASDRAGDFDLYLVSSSGGELERLTFGPGDAVAPTWLGEDRLAFRVLTEEGGELWLLDLRSRATREVAGPIEGLGADRVADRFPQGSWIETVRVRGGDLAMAAGQRTELEAHVVTAAGDTLRPGAALIRWTSLASGTVVVDSLVRGLGEVETTPAALGRREGTARLVASVGGWRADTVGARVGRVVTASGLPTLMEEDWTEGIDRERWTPFGEPAPGVVRRPSTAGGEMRRFFDPGGDANYSSGLVSRAPFSLAGGLSLEFESRVPRSERLYETVRIGLHRDTAYAPVQWAREGRLDLLELGLRGDRSPPELRLPDEDLRLPATDTTGAARRHALQVEPDGRVSYALDGRLLWRSARPRLADALGSRARLRLAGQSLRTDVLVGTVRLWRGVRYTAAPPPERQFRLSNPDPARGDDGERRRPDDGPP